MCVCGHIASIHEMLLVLGACFFSILRLYRLRRWLLAQFLVPWRLIDIQVWAMHTPAYVAIIVLLKVTLHFRSAFAIRGVPGTERFFHLCIFSFYLSGPPVPCGS